MLDDGAFGAESSEPTGDSGMNNWQSDKVKPESLDKDMGSLRGASVKSKLSRDIPPAAVRKIC